MHWHQMFSPPHLKFPNEKLWSRAESNRLLLMSKIVPVLFMTTSNQMNIFPRIYWIANFYHLPTEFLEGNIFMCLSTGGSSCDHYLWSIRPHSTGPTGSDPSPLYIRHGTHWTSDMGPPYPAPDIRHGTPVSALAPPLVTSDGHHWRPVQTCSLKDPLPTPTGTWLLSFSLKPSTNWNVFILSQICSPSIKYFKLFLCPIVASVVDFFAYGYFINLIRVFVENLSPHWIQIYCS